MGIVEEEADECAYWIELLVEAKSVVREAALPLWKEAGELTAIAVASIKSAWQSARTHGSWERGVRNAED